MASWEDVIADWDTADAAQAREILEWAVAAYGDEDEAIENLGQEIFGMGY